MNRFPVLFIGHGSPMNAIETNAYTRRLGQLGKELPRPKSILMVSAHWYTKGTLVSVSEKPETIYDFYGFPPELYQVKYPAPGAPETGYLVTLTVKSCPVFVDTEMGFDHGAWSVLRHLYPEADIPVTQLSIDYSKSPAEHYVLAQELAILRDHGVLIIASGNIVHNLRAANFGNKNAPPFDWNVRFDKEIAQALEKVDHNRILGFEDLGQDAKLSVPTPDHFIPLFYTIGASQLGDAVTTIWEGYEHGSISMRSVMIG